jgi:hypothetical protein
MPDEQVIEMLNRLLAAEYATMIPRLAEAEPFVRPAMTAARAVVQRLIAAYAGHIRGLVEMLLSLRGSPVTPRCSAGATSLHYADLASILPAVVADLRKLVALYEAAPATGRDPVDALIGRILADHRRDLAELDRLYTASASP